MQLKSPFKYVGKTKLGEIYRPFIIILVFSKKNKMWLPIEMIIDTGADYTLFPKRFAEILGVNLKKDCVIEATKGIGGAEKVYQYPKLPCKMGDWQKEIPVGFLDRNDIPPLLGRLKCLEVLKLSFRNLTSYVE